MNENLPEKIELENEPEVLEAEKFEGKKEKKSSEFKDIVKFALIALLIVIPIRTYIAQPFIVSGESMVPTFENGEYLIIDEISYQFNNPERGDVIVFKFPNDTSRFFIKRIIGLPGETVIIRNGDVKIETTDGETIELDETYIRQEFDGSTRQKLEDDEYFVMGDNRRQSSDSRSWGPLQEKYITGKALLRLFPITEFGLYPGHTEKQEVEIITN